MTGRPTIAVVLIVEDEPLLRMLAVDIAEDAGFTVLEARNADEAFAILESRSDVALVFTDVHMPGSMDGARLAQCIRGRWPPIRLILTSGHSIAQELDMPADSLFFPKPYDGYKVVEAMQRMAP